MKTVDLSIYAPIISDKNVGEKIYQTIMEAHPESNDLQICLRGVISMTTFCAKQIFGRLYNKLGSQKFGQSIKFYDASDDLMLIIKMGIRNAVLEQYS